jgi:hypothetical protein
VAPRGRHILAYHFWDEFFQLRRECLNLSLENKMWDYSLVKLDVACLAKLEVIRFAKLGLMRFVKLKEVRFVKLKLIYFVKLQ